MDGTLTAYGAGAGVPLWSFSTDGSPIESSPLVVDGLVYVGTWAGGLHAVDAATGEQRWRYQAPDDIKGSAALANGLIVVGDYSGNVHALDPATGAERWTYTGGTRFYGGPAVRGDTIVIGDVGGAVIAIDARSGAERWRHSTGGSYVYSSPRSPTAPPTSARTTHLPGARADRRVGAMVLRRRRAHLRLGDGR